MKKINLLKGKNWLALGVLCTVVAVGGNLTLAAEGKTAVQEAEAAEIALADTGIAADKAERLRTKADREDGEAVYEVSFIADNVEYEYLIREADGKILEWEMDGIDVGTAVAEESLQDVSEKKDAEADQSQQTDTLIGLEQAKKIALSDAGLKAEDVRFSKIKYEEGGRVTVYEIEFYQGRMEYEYTIDAYSGEIRKMEWD